MAPHQTMKFKRDFAILSTRSVDWSEPEPLGVGERLNSVNEVEGVWVWIKSDLSESDSEIEGRGWSKSDPSESDSEIEGRDWSKLDPSESDSEVEGRGWSKSDPLHSKGVVEGRVNILLSVSVDIFNILERIN